MILLDQYRDPDKGPYMILHGQYREPNKGLYMIYSPPANQSFIEHDLILLSEMPHFNTHTLKGFRNLCHFFLLGSVLPFNVFENIYLFFFGLVVHGMFHLYGRQQYGVRAKAGWVEAFPHTTG